jgi:predicted transcriptional regulator
MAKTPFTLRIDTKERVALENLSKVERRPINQILNEAIKLYLSRKGQKESSLEANLMALRAYRKQDPDSRHAIDAYVEAEATQKDPLEGEPVVVEGQIKIVGPVQSRVRDLLRG